MHLTNHIISNLVSKFNYGVQKRLRFLIIENNNTTLELLKIFYKNGIIRSYRILNNNKISIYFKYFMCNKAIKIKTISRPGNRIYWTLNNIIENYNNKNFSGFYIISTQEGIYTSDQCLLNKLLGGEILLKIEI